jgi:hypothetical protein
MSWHMIMSYTSKSWDNPEGTALALSKDKALMYLVQASS